MDVAARVAAEQTANAHLHIIEILGSVAAFVGEIGSGVDAACAAYEDLAVVFRIEVQKHRAADHILAEVLGSFEADLLVDGEESLNRTVNQILVDHHGHSGGAADAVVGAESGALGLNPLAVDISLDRVFHKIMAYVAVLLGNHVHVGLKDHRRGVLMTGSGRLAHHYVAHLVGLNLDAVVVGEFYEKIPDLLFMAGGTRNFRDFIETFPNEFGFKVFYFHCILFR